MRGVSYCTAHISTAQMCIDVSIHIGMKQRVLKFLLELSHRSEKRGTMKLKGSTFPGKSLILFGQRLSLLVSFARLLFQKILRE